MNYKKTKVRLINSKSIINNSKLPGVSHCINPYMGCSHKCIYCYAHFMKRFSKNKEPWGSYVNVKINSFELVKNQTNILRKSNSSILIGSVTDAYQPIEKKYKITQKLLNELKKSKAKVSILTKSDLVLRDINILKTFNNCSVGLSINTLNESMRKVLEPGSVSINRRLNALKTLHDNRIKTYIFIGPIFPKITDLRSILQVTKGYIDEVMGETLNIKGGVWHRINSFSQNYYEDSNQFKMTVTNKKYMETIKEKFTSLCKSFDLKVAGFFTH